MSISFFIVGGIIFAIYMYLTVWNIFYSSKQQKKENYPNVNATASKTKLSIDTVDKVISKIETHFEK